jgi:hypothetical protein
VDDQDEPVRPARAAPPRCGCGTRQQVEDLRCPVGWDTEYGRDTWRLRELGVEGQHARIR